MRSKAVPLSSGQWYHYGKECGTTMDMARQRKGLTRQFRLRLTEFEYQAIRVFVDHCTERGITISQNDAVRMLVTHGLARPFADEPTARAAVEAHWQACPVCTDDALPRCARGLLIRDRYAAARHLPGGNPG